MLLVRALKEGRDPRSSYSWLSMSLNRPPSLPDPTKKGREVHLPPLFGRKKGRWTQAQIAKVLEGVVCSSLVAVLHPNSCCHVLTEEESTATPESPGKAALEHPPLSPTQGNAVAAREVSSPGGSPSRPLSAFEKEMQEVDSLVSHHPLTLTFPSLSHSLTPIFFLWKGGCDSHETSSW